MWKDLFGDGPWFSDIGWEDLPKAGLLFFFVFFVLMVVWVFRRGARSHYDAVSRLPLESQPPEGQPRRNHRSNDHLAPQSEQG